MSDSGENKLINLLSFAALLSLCLCVCTHWCMDAPCRGTHISPVCLEPSDDGITHLLSASVKILYFPSCASMPCPPSVSFLHLSMFFFFFCSLEILYQAHWLTIPNIIRNISGQGPDAKTCSV